MNKLSFEQVRQALPEIEIKLNLGKRPVISSRLLSANNLNVKDPKSIVVLVRESSEHEYQP